MTYIIYVSECKGTFFSPLPDNADIVKFCERIILAHYEHGGQYKIYSLWVPDFNEGIPPVVTEIV